jgi:hypothetical protein
VDEISSRACKNVNKESQISLLRGSHTSFPSWLAVGLAQFPATVAFRTRKELLDSEIGYRACKTVIRESQISLLRASDSSSPSWLKIGLAQFSPTGPSVTRTEI